MVHVPIQGRTDVCLFDVENVLKANSYRYAALPARTYVGAVDVPTLVLSVMEAFMAMGLANRRREARHRGY